MRDDALRVDVEHFGGSAVVTIAGDIDAYSVLKLRETLDDLGFGKHLTLDMADVRFMDSSGINALVCHALQVEHGGGSLVQIRNPSRAVQRVVELSGMGYLFCATEVA
jgi:anti-anti-sigma factor